MFFGNWLKVEHPEAPSSLIWKNHSYSACNRGCRSVFIWIVSIFLVCCAFYGLILFKNKTDEILLNLGLNT